MTFTEMIIVVAVTSFIMIALVDVTRYMYKANEVAVTQAFAVEAGRKGLSAIVKDLREAVTGEEGSYPLISIATSSVSFYVDTDQDGRSEKVRYFLSGTTLLKGDIPPSGTPATYPAGNEVISTTTENIRNFSQNSTLFRYYDASSTEVTSQSNIGRVVSVTINLIVNVSPAQAPGDFTLQSSATLRNLRSQ